MVDYLLVYLELVLYTCFKWPNLFTRVFLFQQTHYEYDYQKHLTNANDVHANKEYLSFSMLKN